MAFAAPLPIVSVTSVLATLGFKATGSPGHLLFDFGNLVLKALPRTNQYSAPAVLFSGLYRDSRRLREISFEVPDKVESALQVQAWIAYGVGQEFQPRWPCAWLLEGAAAQELLPWEREMRAYRDRPMVLVPRRWMRLAAKDIRDAAEFAPEKQVCVIGFDGRMLTLDLGGRVIPILADGKRQWDQSFTVQLKSLSALPKRWMTDPVPVEVWKEEMRFGNFVLEPSESSTS